jgi:hypothetical protein
MPSPSQIRVRPAVYSDAPDIRAVQNAAFRKSALEEYLAPHRNEFPDDHVRNGLGKTKKALVSPGYWQFVAVVEENGKEKIVGAALWTRRGKSEAAKRWQGDSIANRK